jgi:transcriptional regulator with XRE-family HTH domain
MRTCSQMANRLASPKVRYKRLAPDCVLWHRSHMQTRIKELRKERGMTAEHLASLAGCSKSYMSEIESGKKYPSGRLLQAFAKSLGVSVFELIDSGDLADEIIAHIAVMRDLSEADRRAVVRHAAGLLEQAPAPSE